MGSTGGGGIYGSMGTHAAKGFIEVGSAFGSIRQEQARSKIEQNQIEFAARIADIQASDAIRRGEESANLIRKQREKIKGIQRVSYAGQGVEVASGSAADAQMDTQRAAELDVMTARNNAWMEAWGHRVQAFGIRQRGRYANMASKNFIANKIASTITSRLLQDLNFATSMIPGSTGGINPTSGGVSDSSAYENLASSSDPFNLNSSGNAWHDKKPDYTFLLQ